MLRLTRYEILVLLGAVLVAFIAFTGHLANMPSIFDLSLVVLILLVLVGVMLTILRIDRLLTGQKRTREEIYQVLYSLHGIDKWTETQARKTRDLLRDNHQVLVSELRKVVVHDSSNKNGVENFEATDSITHLEEAERLRFNKLVGILEAHWTLLEVLRQSNPGPN